MIAAMVVPLGWRSNARTEACLEPADAWDEADLGAFTCDAGPGLEREPAALFVALTDRVVDTADLDFLPAILSLFICPTTASCAATETASSIGRGEEENLVVASIPARADSATRQHHAVGRLHK
jgi:hypothetical protein